MTSTDQDPFETQKAARRFVVGTLRYPPAGAWPALMQADMAAAYVDEPDREAFLRKVREGVFPGALKLRGCRFRWAKADLDQLAATGRVPVNLDDDL